MSNKVVNENKCLFLIAEKGKYSIQNLLKPFNPIYNGAGWYIEKKFQTEIEQICSQVKMRSIEFPLNGESFEVFRRRNRCEFMNEKCMKMRLAIAGLKATLGISSLDNQEVLQGEYANSLRNIPEGKRLLESLNEYNYLQEQIKQGQIEEKISKLKVSCLPIVSIADRIISHNVTLEKSRGKKYLGLCVSTISEFNDKMLGLRKLILIAAAPNVGKTALTIQLALETLITNPTACLVYVSLEMTAEEIFTRMNLYLSGLNFETYVLGSYQVDGEMNYQNLFSHDELRKINGATKKMEQIGDRLQIVDMSDSTYLNSEIIINYVDELKSKTGCQRAIVIIDYLQVWPVSPDVRVSDIEADKWRIGEIKKIRDGINKVHQDPVIVISEARKPSESEKAWAGDLADVMGSARGTYTPDAVLLLNPLSSKQLEILWEKMKMPRVDFEDSNIKAFLADLGIAICSLSMPKGRDGMKKFSTLLAFHFHKNKFEKINWLEMRTLIASSCK